MSFIEQAAKIFSETAEFKFHAVMFGRDAFYIEGARPIKIDSSEMIFRVPKAVITVVGKDMTVKELSDECTSVIGAINSFTVTDL